MTNKQKRQLLLIEKGELEELIYEAKRGSGESKKYVSNSEKIKDLVARKKKIEDQIYFLSDN